MSSVYLILASLFAWGVLAGGAQAAVIAIASPIATLSADSRTVNLTVAVEAPQDPVAAARLTFTWNCNLPVIFSSTNSTTRGRTVTATLPHVSAPPAKPAYRFSVLVQDPLDNAAGVNSAVIGTTTDIPVYIHPSSVKVVEIGTGLSFYSVFAPEAGVVNTSFAATMLDQFGDVVDTNAPELLGVTWTLNWNSTIQEDLVIHYPPPQGDVSNPTTAALSQAGVFSVRTGEGIHSYAISGTMSSDQPVAFPTVTGSAVIQTNQVKIMFKPACAQGVSGYLYDEGSQLTAPVGTSLVQWGWNIPGIDTEAMRNRLDQGGSDQTKRCFALMQMLTYRRIVASTDPAHPTDPASVGSLMRDPAGDAIIETNLKDAPAPDGRLMWRLWNLPSGNYTIDIMAGDSVDVGRGVDLELKCGAVSARLIGTTTKSKPWITDSLPFTIAPGQPLVVKSGDTASRNLINTIAIKKNVIAIN